VRDFVKETLLARQAQELGLDKDDIVVRRRLAQKMTFLLQDDSRNAAPSEDDLRRLYEAQQNQIQDSQAQSNQAGSAPQTLFTRPRISFKHIFFSRDQRADAAADARQALQELSQPDGAARAAAMGDRASIKHKVCQSLPRPCDAYGKSCRKKIKDFPLGGRGCGIAER